MKKIALVLVAMAAIGGVGAGATAQSDQPPPVPTERLTIEYQPDDERAAPIVIDELAPEVVLTIGAVGFDRNASGMAKQCVDASGRVCRNVLPVRFDDRGDATFQYLVTDEVGLAAGDDEPCRLGAARCTIELQVGDKVSIVETVFVDAAPAAGHLVVEPRRGLRPGDEVSVSASGFPPAAQLTVMICAEPSTSGSRCGPLVSLTTGGDGTAQAEVLLDVAAVGSDRVACGRRVACRLVVSSNELGVRAQPVILSFAGAPGADYAKARVLLGLGVAVVLIVVAGWLIRSTNWDPPRESDSTPIDEAEYADLDLEAAQFEEPEPALR